MNGVRFYLEHKTSTDKRKGKDAGNVFAAFIELGRRHDGGYEGVGSVFEESNSHVASCSASGEVMRKQMKRISEVHARMVHPRLFEYLEK